MLGSDQCHCSDQDVLEERVIDIGVSRTLINDYATWQMQTFWSMIRSKCKEHSDLWKIYGITDSIDAFNITKRLYLSILRWLEDG